ncbi:MAG: cyclic nucleotide-binding domain-containing protein [Alphaproteobacteria bacterium]|jgi:malate dehydrogenase (oxaloacetate-decarboxylating)(NADP+)|nr:cyclic nucleotide-binding domain-containing protein [Alphaproteobacteria bacterium]
MKTIFLEEARRLVGLDEVEFQTFCKDGCERLVEAGTVIIPEGSRGTSFFVLDSGVVEIRKGGVKIAALDRPGTVFGEMCLFNEQVRVAEVAALEPARLIEIDIETFARQVLQNEPGAVKLMEWLGHIMAERLQREDAAMMSRIAASDEKAAALAEFFAPLKKQLMADWALKYHAIGKPGKLGIVSTKPAIDAAYLSVAYSPGVAEPCLKIRADVEKAYDYTGKSHLVGVVTNGTAVLGLGNIGAAAAKPVMEGKAVLFKTFADVDAFDIEVDERDPERFIDIVCALAPTFGGINLEDVCAPECFHVEEACQQRLDIPVFHDDQHGTAIVAGAALLNALDLVGKRIADIRVVFSGAGAAGFACAKFLLSLGARREQLILTDIDGVVFRGRGDNNYLDELAADTPHRTLAEAIEQAGVFIGVSAAGVLRPEMLMAMQDDPIVFAMANPVPEIDVGLARRTRNDVIMGTGRSDYPNQINNVIAFPYIFRGALDVQARAINEEMKLAAAGAIAALARQPITADAGFDAEGLGFSRDYLVPKPFDRRLLPEVASAVAEAAMRSGVARRALDSAAYRERLREQSGRGG